MLTNTDYKVIADGNGSTQAFTFGFPIIAATDLKVYKVTKATGELNTLLTLNVDYTVTINTVTEGGTVTYTVAPTTLQQSLIYRDVPYTQPEQFPSEGNYPEERIERMGDRLAMLINQVKGAIERAVLLPITSALTGVTLPDPEAGKGIKWNVTEDGFENTTTDPDDVVIAAQAAQAAAELAATNAATAETNAETAETNAETAETNAEAAQAAAEAAAANFEFASQAEAEAGVNATKSMNPLRTAQAIAALTPASGVAGDGTVNPTNLLANGDFEAWSAGASAAPDGYTFTNVVGGTGVIAREGTIKKIGTYSAKLTRVTENCNIADSTQFVSSNAKVVYLRGRTITLGAWVYCDTASRAYLYITDNVGGTFSSPHSGVAGWEWLTVTHTVNAAATLIYPTPLYIKNGDATAYCDGAILVEGSSAFAFSPKPAEEGVWADYSATTTTTGFAVSGRSINVWTKKQGKTVFVEFYITGTSDNATTNFSVPYTAATGPLSGNQIFDYAAQDNGGSFVSAYGSVSGATVTLTKDLSGGAFTATGSKAVRGQFFYEAA